MSINAIGGVSGANSASGTSSVQGKPLSEETKKKLEALGINTSNIKTEEQGQAALASAMVTQNQQQAGGNSQIKDIKSQAELLASDMGISASQNDKISDILENISKKISEMSNQGGKDSQNSQELKQYKDRYNLIASAFLQEQSLHKMMNASAAYNKAYHNL